MAITVGGEEDESINAETGGGRTPASAANGVSPTPLCGSERLKLTFLGLFGFFNMYAQRVNLSVALVAMTNDNATAGNATIGSNDTCPVDDDRDGLGFSAASPPLRGEFADWDQQRQALILGSFFYGYIVTQIPGGILSKRYGGKLLYGLGALCTSIFTLLTPLAARISWKCLVAVRIIEGMSPSNREETDRQQKFTELKRLWGISEPRNSIEETG